MPTYDYRCLECDHTFEAFQSMTDKPLKKCPLCGGRTKRLIGPGAGVIFKGSGFYETDYKRKPAAAGTAEASPDKGKDKGNGKKESSSTKKE